MRSLRGDLVLTVLSHLITKPLWLIADNLVQDRLGHEVYGLIGALHSLAGWANVVADWSLSYHIARHIAQAPQLLPTTAARTFLPKTALSLFTFGLFLLIGYLIGYARENFWWLSGLLIYQIGLAFIQYFRSFFQGMQLFRIDALLGNAEKAIIIILLLAFWGHISGGIYIAILAGGSMIALLGIWGWAWKRFRPWKLQIQTGEIRALFQRLSPYTILVLVSGLNERLNQVFLERLVGPYENGLYAGAYRWFSASMMYLWIVLPIFFARFAMLGYRPTPLLWRTFLLGQLSASIPLMTVTLLMFVEPRLFLIFFRHSTAHELEVMAVNLQVLALAGTLNALFNIYSTHLTANGREKASLVVMVFATLANTLACWLWTPKYGAMGGSLALLLSYAIFSLGHYGLFQGWVRLPKPVSLLPWLLLGIWVVIGAAILWIRVSVPATPLGFWGVMAALSFWGVLYALRVLHLWRRVSSV